MNRSSGALLPISSLPGSYGIGTLGENARRFARLLRDCGFSCWQILPLSEPDEYHSPYKSPSAFAGNPYLIDLEQLAAQGLLLPDELASARQTGPHLCEFDSLPQTKLPLLRRAFSRIAPATREAVGQFAAKHAWVAGYAEFQALKLLNGGAPWQSWRRHTPQQSDAEFYCYLQYEFFRQWHSLKAYANQLGVAFLGDMPFYVSLDSADCYAKCRQGIFQLDEAGFPLLEAGVPPDYFAAEGQRWGNPLYNWDALKEDGYGWWLRRLRHALAMYDLVRVDHFRGFSNYWAIPTGQPSAAGHWERGPGLAFIQALRAALPCPGIVAEDLGDIDSGVSALLEAAGFPGMRVFQFAFSGDPANPHLPYQYTNHCVAYTGTHDNNTLLGWLWELPPRVRARALQLCGYQGDWKNGGAQNPALKAIMRALLQSSAGLVILPVQDLCGFGGDARINTPGVGAHNWAVRFTWDQLEQIDKSWCLEMNALYGRTNRP
jgi:4-alpha-glucanotransferase